RQAVMAERSFLKALGGGCQVPIGALAQVTEDNLVLQGVVANTDGSFLVRGEVKGNAHDFSDIGQKLAERLLASGADEILGIVQP
ncbi:MAG: hydroxymethylbilane synthase, partial [Armatimonadota bacterium]